jgi:hypothetical protein
MSPSLHTFLRILLRQLKGIITAFEEFLEREQAK